MNNSLILIYLNLFLVSFLFMVLIFSCTHVSSALVDAFYESSHCCRFLIILLYFVVWNTACTCSGEFLQIRDFSTQSIFYKIAKMGRIHYYRAILFTLYFTIKYLIRSTAQTNYMTPLTVVLQRVYYQLSQ